MGAASRRIGYDGRMKTRNIVMIAVVSAIFLAAGVLVAVGVLTHSEPGLMGYCPASGQYEVDGARDCPELTLDSSLPIVVTAESDHPTMDPENATADIVDRINHRLGFTLLQFDEGGCDDHATICVFAEVPFESGFMDTNGSARHFMAEGTLRCEARTSNTGTAEMFDMVLEHEILHCLGLAHDDFDSSIMRPTQTHTPDGEFPPGITDDDRATLRDRYMP